MSMAALVLAASVVLSPADEAAAFQAAGFERQGGGWIMLGCNEGSDYSPGKLAHLRDLNGDGRPELVIVEGGSFCYGHTGQGFWLLTRRADGGWRLMMKSAGIPEFQRSKGVDGYPDVQIGGPGFCFPVARWNGNAYQTQRWQYAGKPCKRPG